MTGEEMLAEIERREAPDYEKGIREIERIIYYAEKERKNMELVDCMVYAAIWLVIIVCLLSIAGHVKELWDGLTSGL